MRHMSPSSPPSSPSRVTSRLVPQTTAASVTRGWHHSSSCVDGLWSQMQSFLPRTNISTTYAYNSPERSPKAWRKINQQASIPFQTIKQQPKLEPSVLCVIESDSNQRQEQQQQPSTQHDPFQNHANYSTSMTLFVSTHFATRRRTDTHTWRLT